MAINPSSAFSFEVFVRQVTRVREAMETPAGRRQVRDAGVEPEGLLQRVHTVERIGAAMRATDFAEPPSSLTAADKERVARSSGASMAEIEELLARYRMATALGPDA